MSYLDNFQTLDARLSGRRKHDQFFMKLVDTMNIGVAVTDCERKIIYSNKNVGAITGHFDNNKIGMDLADSFDSLNSQILKITYQDCLERTKASVELCWQHPNGKQVNARISLTAFEAPSQKNRLFLVAITDITEFKNAQKAIVYSENKYKAVVENSLTGLFIEQDNKIVFANRRLAEMFGFEMDHLIGTETHRLLQFQYNGFTEEIQTHRKDGKSIWIKLKSRSMAYQGKPAVLCNVIEISREKMMENRLLDLEQKLCKVSDQQHVDYQNQRKKLAAELHNGIGRSLAAAKDIIEKAIAIRSNNPNVVQDLNKITAFLQHASDEARRITRALHPALLDDSGLKATVVWHCHQYQDLHSSIKISLAVTIEENKLAESLKAAIYRILQEALNDIAEHVGTTRIKIHLFASTGKLNLVIKDNGISLSLPAKETNRSYRLGLGPDGIKEIVRQTGGKFAIGKNIDNQGHYLCCSWPVDSI